MHVLQVGLHVVAQVVEAEFVVRGIGDVGAVGRGLLDIGLARIDHTGGQPQRGIDLAHPLGVSLGKVFVDRHDMDVLTGQGVKIGRESRDERLALAGLHLGDVALVEEDPAQKLDVEGPEAERTARRLAAVREGFGQERFQGLPRLRPALQFACLLLEPLVGQRTELVLEPVDLLDRRHRRLDLAVVRRSEHLLRDRSDTEHLASASHPMVTGWFGG